MQWIQSRRSLTCAPPIANFARVDREFAVTGRVGWLAKPETLFYVKGGPAWLRMTPNNTYWIAQNPINTTPVTTMSGYEAGIGVESYLIRYSVSGSRASILTPATKSSSRARFPTNSPSGPRPRRRRLGWLCIFDRAVGLSPRATLILI